MVVFSRPLRALPTRGVRARKRASHYMFLRSKSLQTRDASPPLAEKPRAALRGGTLRTEPPCCISCNTLLFKLFTPAKTRHPWLQGRLGCYHPNTRLPATQCWDDGPGGLPRARSGPGRALAGGGVSRRGVLAGAPLFLE